jgi:pentatricopeptide repeat protein
VRSLDDMIMHEFRPEGYMQLESKKREYVLKPLQRQKAIQYLTDLRTQKSVGGSLLQGAQAQAAPRAIAVSESQPADLAVHERVAAPDNVDADAIETMASFLNLKAPDFASAKEVVTLCKELNKPLSVESFAKVLTYASKVDVAANAQFTVDLFDTMVENGLVPDAESWTALVRAKCVLEGPEGGQAVIERLEKIGVPIIMDMYNHVLATYVDNGQFEKAEDYFGDMHFEGKPNTRSFEIMFNKCRKAHEMERALGFFEEMKALEVPRDEALYCAYIKAVAEGPHWVKGFETTLYEAILKIEADQFVPTVALYNSIIYAFARARDSKAAEYYFWEMKEKGLKPDTLTYDSLLLALAREQAIGAKTYGGGVREA